MSWTDAEVLVLQKLWCVDGLSAGQIGARMGKTRNSVIAKVWRKGWSKQEPKTTRARSGKFTHQGRRSQARETERALGIKPERLGRPKQEPLPPPEPVPETKIHLPDLEPHHCRWIMGHPADGSNWSFCGQTREGPLPYCPEHQKRAYTASYEPVRSRENAKSNWKIHKAKTIITEGVEG